MEGFKFYPKRFGKLFKTFITVWEITLPKLLIDEKELGYELFHKCNEKRVAGSCFHNADKSTCDGR